MLAKAEKTQNSDFPWSLVTQYCPAGRICRVLGKLYLDDLLVEGIFYVVSLKHLYPKDSYDRACFRCRIFLRWMSQSILQRRSAGS